MEHGVSLAPEFPLTPLTSQFALAVSPFTFESVFFKSVLVIFEISIIIILLVQTTD